jgi:uncharacterized repeat protein (TIGR03806 family)
MKKHYAYLFILSSIFATIIISCSKTDEETYLPVASVSPVSVDLTTVPYNKLSEYKFFEGEMKNQNPSLNVLPFEPASALFTDYAHKKRFVWIPKGKKAIYNSDKTILELPIGAALVKTFYYDNVQNVSPVGATRLIETRVMIRKANGWIFADYIWNAAQTEAYYDLAGSETSITWKDENNAIKSAPKYRIPAAVQCIICHKNSKLVNGVVQTSYIPIGIKPQNLNFNYNYASGSKNQLSKWIEQGYLENNFTFPDAAHTVINYNDTSKSLESRARSYVDSNCSHCHADERHCDYRPMRFAFSETLNNRTSMGVCVDTEDMQDFPEAMSTIVTPGNIDKSMMYYRLNTIDESYRMPLHGRTVIHEEGIALIAAWINSLQPCD